MPRAEVSGQVFREEGIQKATVLGITYDPDPFKGKGAERDEDIEEYYYQVTMQLEDSDEPEDVLFPIQIKMKGNKMVSKGRAAGTVERFHLLLDAIGYPLGVDGIGRFKDETDNKVIPYEEVGDYLTLWLSAKTNGDEANVVVFVYDKYNKKAGRSYSTIWDRIYPDTKAGNKELEEQSKKFMDWYSKQNKNSDEEAMTPVDTGGKTTKRRM